MDYINSINFEEDKTRAYTSNSAYKSVTLSDKDKKLPQSTGEEIFFKRQEYNSEKVINEFENIYRNLQAKVFAYEGSIYLAQIVAINAQANLRKLNNKLISELEYKGLELQNLGNELQVKQGVKIAQPVVLQHSEAEAGGQGRVAPVKTSSL